MIAPLTNVPKDMPLGILDNGSVSGYDGLAVPSREDILAEHGMCEGGK